MSPDARIGPSWTRRSADRGHRDRRREQRDAVLQAHRDRDRQDEPGIEMPVYFAPALGLLRRDLGFVLSERDAVRRIHLDRELPRIPTDVTRTAILEALRATGRPSASRRRRPRAPGSASASSSTGRGTIRGNSRRARTTRSSRARSRSPGPVGASRASRVSRPRRTGSTRGSASRTSPRA